MFSRVGFAMTLISITSVGCASQAQSGTQTAAPSPWASESLGPVSWGAPTQFVDRQVTVRDAGEKIEYRLVDGGYLVLSSMPASGAEDLSELGTEGVRRMMRALGLPGDPGRVQIREVEGVRFAEAMTVLGSARAPRAYVYHSATVVNGRVFRSDLACVVGPEGGHGCMRALGEHARLREVRPALVAAR